jgi:hypothetical protein
MAPSLSHTHTQTHTLCACARTLASSARRTARGKCGKRPARACRAAGRASAWDTQAAITSERQHEARTRTHTHTQAQRDRLSHTYTHTHTYIYTHTYIHKDTSTEGQTTYHPWRPAGAHARPQTRAACTRTNWAVGVRPPHTHTQTHRHRHTHIHTHRHTHTRALSLRPCECAPMYHPRCLRTTTRACVWWWACVRERSRCLPLIGPQHRPPIEGWPRPPRPHAHAHCRPTRAPFVSMCPASGPPTPRLASPAPWPPASPTTRTLQPPGTIRLANHVCVCVCPRLCVCVCVCGACADKYIYTRAHI